MDKIEIPKGLTVVEIADLKKRYLQGLESDDNNLRGYAASFLAGVDPYNKDSAAAVAKLLKDKDNWERRMAAGALARFGKQAEPALPTMKSMLNNKDEQVKGSIRKTITTIENAKDNTDAAKKHRALLAEISAFIKSQRKDGN